MMWRRGTNVSRLRRLEFCLIAVPALSQKGASALSVLPEFAGVLPGALKRVSTTNSLRQREHMFLSKFLAGPQRP